jgi:hypothetical protein
MEKFAKMEKFSRAGIGHLVDRLWINSNTYFSQNFAPDHKNVITVKDLSNAGHLLISQHNEDGSKSYLAGFPFQLEDNEFATGVDHTSCSAAYIMHGYQDKIWIMAPQGTWKDGANVEHNNSNALVVKSALDTASLTFSCPHALFNGAAAEVALTGDATPIEISGIGATTVDDKLVLTMGSNMAASYPIGVKSMKRRTVKVTVHPVASSLDIFNVPLQLFYINRNDTSVETDKINLAQKIKSVLDLIYSKQVNLYFDVTVSDLKVKNYDTSDLNQNVAVPDGIIDTFALEGELMISDMNDTNSDIQIYLIYDKKLRDAAAGTTAIPSAVHPNCSWVVTNPNLQNAEDTICRTIAHEIGHIIIGPGHPDDVLDAIIQLPELAGGRARLKGTDTTKRLMQSHVRTSLKDVLLVKAEWDEAETWLKKFPDKRYRDEHLIPVDQPLPNY